MIIYQEIQQTFLAYLTNTIQLDLLLCYINTYKILHYIKTVSLSFFFF